MSGQSPDWFKDVPGFEGRYAVDPYGKVYSYHKCGLLKPGLSGTYLTVSFGRNNSRCVHELILTTFIGPRPSPNHVSRHLDGNSLHNSIFNLEWATYSRNEQDKKYHKGQRTYKLTPESAASVKTDLRLGMTTHEISQRYGIARSTVSAIATGKFHLDVHI